MSSPVFEREVRASMQTLLNVAQMSAGDGASSVVRMTHHFAALAKFDAPERFQNALGNLERSCMVALGGEELPVIRRPEVPAYREHLSQWDPVALKANLEACKRVGLRIRAWENQNLREWLDYTINNLEAA